MTAPTDENSPFPADLSTPPAEPRRDDGPFRDRGETLRARKRALEEELAELDRELAPRSTPLPSRRVLAAVALVAALVGIATTATLDRVYLARERTASRDAWALQLAPKPAALGTPKHGAACDARFGPT